MKRGFGPRSVAARLLAVGTVGVLLLAAQTVVSLNRAEDDVEKSSFRDAQLLARLAAGEITTAATGIVDFLDDTSGDAETLCQTFQGFSESFSEELRATIRHADGSPGCAIGDTAALEAALAEENPPPTPGVPRLLDTADGSVLVITAVTSGAAVTLQLSDTITPASVLAERPDVAIVLLQGDRLVDSWPRDDNNPDHRGLDIRLTALPAGVRSTDVVGLDLFGTARYFSAVDSGPFTVLAGVDQATALEPLSEARRMAASQAMLGAAALLVLLLLTSRSIASPAQALARHLANADRSDPLELPEKGPTEIADVARELNRYDHEARTSAARLDHLAHHDPLTNTANRTMLIKELTWLAERSGIGDRRYLAIQVEGLGDVARAHGRAVLEAAIVEVATRLEADVDDGELLAQLAPDRFVVVAGPRALIRSREIADHVHRSLSVPVSIGDVDVMLGARVGVVVPDADSTPESLLADVDAALEASHAGETVVFGDDERSTISRRIERTDELRAAITDGRIDIAFQAISSCVDDRVVALEALARWRHPLDGWISPVEFIPLAERSGLVAELGESVLVAACRELAAWYRELGPTTPSVAVNVSVHQLTSDFPERVAAILRRTGLPAELLTLEVTESVFSDDTVTHAARLDVLRAIGVRVAIDDFGTGWSSLARLADLPADYLKMDRAFLSGLSNDSRARAITDATIRLAHSVDLLVVAEGIETPEVDQILRDLGVDMLQGYLHHRPDTDLVAVRDHVVASHTGAPSTSPIIR